MQGNPVREQTPSFKVSITPVLAHSAVHAHTQTHTHTHVFMGSCTCARSLQPCQTLYNPMGCSLPGSSVHRILQARILGWVAMPFPRESSPPRDQTCFSYVSCIGRRVLTTSTIWEFPRHNQKFKRKKEKKKKKRAR